MKLIEAAIKYVDDEYIDWLNNPKINIFVWKRNFWRRNKWLK